MARPDRVDTIKENLRNLNVLAISVVQVHDHAPQNHGTMVWRAHEYTAPSSLKMEIRMVVNDDQFDSVIQVIMRAARTGQRGDGHVCVDAGRPSIRYCHWSTRGFIGVMSLDQAVAGLPRALSSYPDRSSESIGRLLIERVEIEPFNAIATAIFVLAILHTFAAARFTAAGSRLQHATMRGARGSERPTTPSVGAEVLHFLGEVEVVFGLWAVVLLVAMTATPGGTRPGTI